MPLVAAALWRARPELVLALDERFGDPLDAYVNGSQVWVREDGPGGVALEWRLHPVAGYRRPDPLGTYDVFARTALALGTGGPLPAPLDRLWDGLEVFAAYDDELEPSPLASAATSALACTTPNTSASSNTSPLADEWERTRGEHIGHRQALRSAETASFALHGFMS